MIAPTKFSGIIFWFLLVALTAMSWYNAYRNRLDIAKFIDEEKNNPNETVRKAGKVRVTQAFSNDSTASQRSRQATVGHGATNGFASSARRYEGVELAWER